MERRICAKCGVEKQLEQFVKHKYCRDGRTKTCKDCANIYSREWKRKNSKRLSAERRRRYAETEGVEVKKREEARKALYPLRYRCQLLRRGMIQRAKKKNIQFDEELFTVSYLMDRLRERPNCECCGRNLDVGFKENKQRNDSSPSMDRVDSNEGYTRYNTAIICWRCNKCKQDSTAKELRIIADFIDSWGNEIDSDVSF